MNYEQLCQRLSNIYDAGEAKAIVRWVLDVRFGLSTADIYCGKVTQLSPNDQAELDDIHAQSSLFAFGTAPETRTAACAFFSVNHGIAPVLECDGLEVTAGIHTGFTAAFLEIGDAGLFMNDRNAHA